MRSTLLLFGIALSIAFPLTVQAVEIEGDRATFQWQGASGPVAGYHVFVTRNGAPGSAPELSVSGTSASVSSAIGDTVVVRVAAYDEVGNQGPMSAPSESVMFVSADPPPPTSYVDSDSDTSMQAAIDSTPTGSQVSVRLAGDERVLLDAAIPDDVDPSDGLWGLDQLVVGTADTPTTVRLVDSLGLDSGTPLLDLPEVTLFGLGNGEPCARDGEPGLVIHAGSSLVLGGMELYAFDGESCVHVNELFAQSPEPNRIFWGDGEIRLHGDLEGDGVIDPEDNCLLESNPDQCDTDGDGFGNACDFDVDGNGIADRRDMSLVLQAATRVSSEARFDINCDGGAALDDVDSFTSRAFKAPGPSGLACASDASCEPQ